MSRVSLSWENNLLAGKAFRMLFNGVITRENPGAAGRMGLDSQGYVFQMFKKIVQFLSLFNATSLIAELIT